ncbi:pimeloyl-ACP methyl ester carboxylesterase [Kineothrix alysoides]|uniref:Pimeloyl-ACP methyl ester carboxylesterase n=1 Tax=Kineothrix alysoides TaxID=1469948 RepID=A0A4R1QWV6_9FIRM|nr:alpha/beta hydrolase [Kineothrix alysoides]TCL57971.1 pimeloyl-ACP methyl ester carboxylesterase [Kineothrix alysoides]
MVKKYIENNRGKVFYWINEEFAGTKDKGAIMFTHGLTADHTLFDKQTEYLQDEMCVITWDMPLHGENRPYKGFSFKNAAADMNQILETEGIEKAVMAGQSAGGYCAQAFALFYPEKTAGFISIDSTPFGLKYYKKSELFWTDHYDAIARWYPYEFYCKLSAKSACTTEEARLSFYQALVRLGKKGMLEAAKALYRDFTKYPEVDFKCPVLLFLGEKDKVGYVKKYNEMWEKETGYPLVVIPGAGHNSNFDGYEFFNRKVIEFMTTQSMRAD